MKKEKVIIAFSGGLDTSYCVKYLSETLGLEVHTAVVNTGGFSGKELLEIKERAISLGAITHKSIDQIDNFYNKSIKYLVYGNVLKNNTYPLSVSAERIFQGMAIAEYAKEFEADYIAHGSTGAGNDQVRFDLAFSIIAPEIKVLTPIRDQKLSRQSEIEFLAKHGVNTSWEKAKYSINKGLWGTSVGGEETLTSNLALPDSAYPSQLSKSASETIRITFEKGEISGLNGEKMSSVLAIQMLNELAGQYAIGRDIHVGDTIIGIKGRVGFEAAAPLIIIKSHELLEKHTLTKWQIYWKEQLANWYGMQLHEGQYLDPTLRNIESFLEDTQTTVSGEVIVKLSPYQFTLQGIESSHDLMNSKFGDYGEMNNAWSGEDVKGFTKILSNQTKIYHAVND
jgi:argininosuccinate synthase